MPLPTGIVTRPVSFGAPFGIADGSPLSMRVTFTPSRSMVWGALGFPGIAREYTVTSGAGLQGTVALPVTDQAGWVDGLGNALSVAGGAQTHSYLVDIKYLDAAGATAGYVTPRNIVLPTGDLSTVDLDTMIPVSTAAGVVVAIPDIWSQQLAAAQAAAAVVAAAVVFRGTWTPATGYPANSLVTNAGAVYLAAADVPARTTFTAGGWLALSGTSSGGTTTSSYLTEAGDQLTTEAGDLLLLDAA